MMPTKKPTKPNSDPPIDRCLSLLQPWAWAVSTFKSIENRTWSTAFRGRLAIHASRSLAHLENPANDDFLFTAHPAIATALDDSRIADERPLFSLGAIIGSVEIVDCVPFDPATDDPDVIFAAYASTHLAPEIPFGMWADGPVCWVLARPSRYRRPIECRGALNVWRLTPALVAAVVAAELDLLTDPGEPPERPEPAESTISDKTDAATNPLAKTPAKPPKSTANDRRKRAALIGGQMPAAAAKKRK